ncbi:MAG: hypothetical protein AABX16_04505 [Nanoarchaeota archaeon]
MAKKQIPLEKNSLEARVLKKHLGFQETYKLSVAALSDYILQPLLKVDDPRIVIGAPDSILYKSLYEVAPFKTKEYSPLNSRGRTWARKSSIK